MSLLQNLPLRHKLTFISVITSGVALLLACAAFITYEQIAFRRDMARELEIAAHIIGANSASALAFDDKHSAAETLKSLANQPHIVRSCIYDLKGNILATYHRDPPSDDHTWPAPRDELATTNETSISLFHGIRFRQEPIGSIYLQSDLVELHERRWRYIAIAGVVMLMALLVTWLLASRLQRVISEPLAQLSALAANVGARKDYAMRAVKSGDDEIGRLVDGFNSMLAQIQTRDAELHSAHKDLESRVEERTRSLEEARQEVVREKSRFQFIFDNLPVGISFHSSQNGTLNVRLINDAHLRICGLGREETQDPGVFQKISHPDDFARQTLLQQQLEKGEIDHFHLEKRYLRPDGEVVWVAFSAQRKNFAGGRTESLCTVVDITDLKRAQMNADREQERFKFIFDFLPVGISLYSRRDQKTSFIINDAHLRLCDVTREHLAAKYDIFKHMTHPEDLAKQSILQERLDAGLINRYSLEKRYLLRDGRTIWVVFSTQQRHYPDGGVDSLTAVSDITDLKHAQEEAAREQTRLKFIFESVPVGISLYSGNRDNLKLSFLINDAHLDICGVTREQAMADDGLFARLTHPDDYARQTPLNLALARNEVSRFSLEKRYLRPDGRVAWVVFSAQRNDYPDGRVETLGTVVDITDLKQAQEDAAREQERLKFIFESVPVGIALAQGTREKTTLRMINDAHLRICGLTRDEADVPANFTRIQHPDDVPKQIPLMQRLETGEIDRFSLEKRYLKPDGHIAWVVFSAQDRLYDDGTVERLTTVVDITELKRVQQEATREQSRFKFIFESLPVGVSWRLLGKGGPLLINPAHERITGVPGVESLDPAAFARVTHPDDRALQAGLVQRFTDGVIDRYSLEKRYIHADGKVVWVVLMSRMSVDPESGERQSVTTLVDITELKHAQEEIARERTRFKYIFDTLPVGVAWMLQGRPDTRIINPSFARITGVPVEHCQEIDRFIQATHPDDRPYQHAQHLRLKSGEIDQFSFEKRYRHDDGSVCWAAYTLRFLSDPAGDEIQELTTLVDINERKRTEAELDDIHKRLLDTSRQAGMAEVATGVLHNVGNVLNSVNVSATLVTDQMRRSKIPNVGKLRDLLHQHRDDLGRFLGEDPKGRLIPAYLGTLADALAAEQKTFIAELESLHKNIGHIKDIVAMQQSYAKTSGVVETISVPDLVEDALRMNAGSLARHDVDVVREYDGRPVITVEKNKVLQILVNLIRNAKYACDDSGRVDKRLTLRTTSDEHGVTIAVIDNGVGIPAENLTRIFAHGFTTRKHGHGFGLHSGALAAKEMGGDLQVRSEGLGKGASFTLRLPFSQESVPS